MFDYLKLWFEMSINKIGLPDSAVSYFLFDFYLCLNVCRRWPRTPMSICDVLWIENICFKQRKTFLHSHEWINDNILGCFLFLHIYSYISFLFDFDICAKQLLLATTPVHRTYPHLLPYFFIMIVILSAVCVIRPHIHFFIRTFVDQQKLCLYAYCNAANPSISTQLMFISI